MPISKRLRTMLEPLSPQALRELGQLISELIAQREEHAEGRAQVSSARARQHAHYTYRQEYVKCGKAGCKCAKGQGHGPYWYRYWKEGGRLKKRYIGTKKHTGGD